MSAKSSDPSGINTNAPFGAQSRRSMGPLVLLGIIYLCWFVLLVWMAACQSGD